MVKGAARSGDNSMLIHWLRFSNTVAGGYSFVPVPDPPVREAKVRFRVPEVHPELGNVLTYLVSTSVVSNYPPEGIQEWGQFRPHDRLHSAPRSVRRLGGWGRTSFPYQQFAGVHLTGQRVGKFLVPDLHWHCDPRSVTSLGSDDVPCFHCWSRQMSTRCNLAVTIPLHS